MSEPETTEPAQAPARSAGRSRRLGIIALLLALAAVAFWVASRVTWAELVAADGLAPPRNLDVKGADWAPALTPLAIVFVAGIAAVAALRGWALRVAAVLVALVAALGTVPAFTLLTGDDDTGYAAKAIDLKSTYQALEVETSLWPAILVLAGAMSAVIGAVVMLQTASRDAPMSSKYKSPAARRAELEEQVFAQRAAEQKAAGTGSASQPAATPPTADGDDSGNNERMLWDALDTGDDPTIGPADR
jgi:uncharacterized membrane protein (TIGR02234 family)